MLLVAALLVGLLPAVSLPTAAADGDSSDPTVEYHFSGGTIYRYSGSGMEVVIPETINGVKVEAISDGAFAGCSSLIHITIPDGVTYIDGGAFEGCFSLTGIQVAETNKNYCSVNGVLFSKDQTTICRYPAGCSEKSYAIPDTVTEIDSVAFSGCTSLTSIAISDSVATIGDFAFSGCSSLSSITIPAGVTRISSVAFSDCSSLTEIRVAENNPSYCSVDGVLFSKDQKTLCHYPKGRSEKSYVVPDGVTEIDAETFSGCTSLTSITIPDGVTEIGWHAFYGCSSLSSITIPDSVTKIAENAFSGCESLTRLNLQSSAGTLSLSVSVSASADVEGNAVLRVLYPGTENDWSAEWEASGIQNDSLRAYLTSRVVYGSAEAFVWGDADGNGKVESKDKVLVSRYLAKWTMNGGFNQAAADFNKDGDVTSAEAVVLARYLAKWTNLPYPVGQKAS